MKPVLFPGGNSFLKLALKFPLPAFQRAGQRLDSVPSWHLQLLQILLIARADIPAVSTHISPTTIICRLFKKKPALVQQRSHCAHLKKSLLLEWKQMDSGDHLPKKHLNRCKIKQLYQAFSLLHQYFHSLHLQWAVKTVALSHVLCGRNTVNRFQL